MTDNNPEEAQVVEPVTTEITNEEATLETTPVIQTEEKDKQDTDPVEQDPTESTTEESILPIEEEKNFEAIKAERELLTSKNKELEAALADLEKQKQVMQKRVDDNVAFNEKVKEELSNQNQLVRELAEQRNVYKSKTYEALKEFQSGEADYDEYRTKLTAVDQEMEGRVSDLQDKLAASRAHNKILEASKIAGLDDHDRSDLEQIISEQPQVWFQKASYNEPEDLALLIDRVIKPMRERRVSQSTSSNTEVSELKKQLDELKALIISQQKSPEKPKVDKPVLSRTSGTTATQTTKQQTKSDYPLLFK